MFWRIAFTIIPFLITLMVIYLGVRAHKFSWVQSIGEKSKLLGWLLAFLVPVVLVAPFCFFMNTVTVTVVLLHLFLFWIVFDLCGFIINKLRKSTEIKYYAGYVAIIFTIIYLSVGWYNAHHIRETHYEVATSKDIESPVRIAAIADSHLGKTLSGKNFAKAMENLQQANPDLVVVVGDYVDDETPKEDMLMACEALGDLETKYGVYFVYGNHDNGYYNYRDFDSAELAKAIESKGITILRDECVEFPCGITLVGRLDRTFASRKSASEIMEGVDRTSYSIMLDHQPNDYDNETLAAPGMVISGHTHGGHMFPAGILGRLMKVNDKVYGHEKRESTDFIVTSGVSGWAVPFKTGTFSEYVIIDILG